MDATLERYLTKRDGVFIEAGANSGFTASNTYYLERFRDWSGLFVEGIPRLAAIARRNRPKAQVFNCALVPLSQDGTDVEMIYGDTMSLVVGAMGSAEKDDEHIRKGKAYNLESGSYRVKVPGRSLSAIIDESGMESVDFLSLDVEGFEAQVLRGIDFNRHRPEWICVEARHINDIERVIGPYYRLVECLGGLDNLYHIK